MKRKIINFIIYIIVFIIIFASFIIPNKLFELQDQSFEMAIYTENDSKGNNISLEAQDIYLVKLLHDIENEKTGVIISSSEIITSVNDENITTFNKKNSNRIANIESEIEKLKQYNIIKDNQILDNSEIEISIINKMYEKDNTKYTINTISLTANNYDWKFDIEEKTGKIIKLIVNKDNLNNAIEKKEILENYIKYLDLYIIDDWVYENNMMKSKKADITVSLVENVNNGICMLSVNSNEKISGNLTGLTEYISAEN